MDNDTLIRLLAEHQPRPLPASYGLLAPAAEIAAQLQEHAADRQRWQQELAEQARIHDQSLAEATSVVYLLDEALGRAQAPLEQAGLLRAYRELRILKDRLIQLLADQGCSWRDPLGLPFEGDLPELVNVDGWRYGPEYDQACVAQVREPIIMRHGVVIREGSVVVGAPGAAPPPAGATRAPE
jgi:hypothetical protein